MGRLEKVYESRGALGPLIYYFLKYDPAFGKRELRRQTAKKSSLPAYDGSWAQSPALERIAIEFLSSGSTPLMGQAAGILGEYHSQDAKLAVWRAIENFSAKWKGRGRSLDQTTSKEDWDLEFTLARSFDRASGWVLTETELKSLKEMCSSLRCNQEVDNALWLAQSPVRINPPSLGLGSFTGVGPFTVNSDEQLRRKLSQYPAGTKFQLLKPFNNENPDVIQARKRIEAAIRENGHSLLN